MNCLQKIRPFSGRLKTFFMNRTYSPTDIKIFFIMLKLILVSQIYHIFLFFIMSLGLIDEIWRKNNEIYKTNFQLPC